MNKITEKTRGEVATETADAGEGEAPVKSSRRRAILIAALMLVVAVVGVTWWFSRPRNSRAGRTVPAPRTTTLSEPAASGADEPRTEDILTLTQEALSRAGIKTETLGTQLTAEGAGAAATGVVEPNSYRTTPVVSLVGGVVRSVGAELGQRVERGKSLAVVFSDELSAAQSKYLTALAALDEHHKAHQRTEELLEIGAASREELEQSATKVKSAEAEVAAIRERLLFLGLTPERVGALRSPSQVSSEVSLSAPVSGTVISRSVNPGEVIEAHKELLRVADLSRVWVITQVFEKDLSRVRVGGGAGISTGAYPGRLFRGQVTYVDPAINQATRTAQVRVEVENPGGALKIGMYVNVAIGSMGGVKAGGASVPISAVQQVGGGQVVFVATNDPSVFLLRHVRLGPEANGYHPVLEGLSPGERVVTEGSFLLRAEWMKLHPGGP